MSATAMPASCSVDGVFQADAIVKAVVESNCTGSNCGTLLRACVANCINNLPPSEVGPLFIKLCASLKCMISEKQKAGMVHDAASRLAKHIFRKNLGVGYGSLLLGSVFPTYRPSEKTSAPSEGTTSPSRNTDMPIEDATLRTVDTTK